MISLESFEIKKDLRVSDSITLNLPDPYSKTGKDEFPNYEMVKNVYEFTPNSARILSNPKPIKRSQNSHQIPSGGLKRYKLLREEYMREMKSYGDYIQCDPREADLLIFKFIDCISKIGFINAAIEFTPSNSVKFSLSLKKNTNSNLMLVITRPFHSLDDLEDEAVIFSIFEEETLLLSNALPITSLVEGINSYLAD
jgi:hypothetical protein